MNITKKLSNKNIKKTKIKSKKNNIFLQKAGANTKNNPNKIKMVCCHGIMIPGNKFILPSGVNVIYITEPNKIYYNINNTDNEIFNVLKSNNFDVNNLFDLGTLKKKK